MTISQSQYELAIRIGLTIFAVARIAWFLRKNKSVELLIFISLLSILLGVNLLQQNSLLKLTDLHLTVVHWIGILIVFEPEVYRLLAFLLGKIISKKKSGNLSIVEEVASGAQILAGTKTGALIAFEREDDLSKLAQSGTPVNSDVKKELMTALFSKDALTHDGGVIIKNGRITYCSVIFPLTFSLEIDKKFGTRHRAAIGLTESTDAICLVVSEEEGTVSLAKDGEVFYNLDQKTIQNHLNQWLSAKTYKRYYPIHQLRTFRLIESSAVFLKFIKSFETAVYDFTFLFFWIFLEANILFIQNGALNTPVLERFFSSTTLINKPWELIPVFLAAIHLWFGVSKQEILFASGTNLFTKKSAFLILPTEITKRSFEDCGRIHVKRESKFAPLWSLLLEDKKGKKIRLDSAGSQNTLLTSAKQIHEFVKIELINHS